MPSARRAGSQQATLPAIASVMKIVAGIQKPAFGNADQDHRSHPDEHDAERAAEHAADREVRPARRR